MINTARYNLLDVASVTAALDSGQIAGPALDVFDREPPTGNSLVGHERVIAAPHIGGFTEERVDRAVTAAVENLLQHLHALQTKEASHAE